VSIRRRALDARKSPSRDVGQVRLDDIPKPEIQEPTDAILKVTATAICGR